MKKYLNLLFLLIAQTASAQSFYIDGISQSHMFQTKLSASECKQFCFPNEVPAGNYSGIAYMGNDKYAVVSDKSETDGFFIFDIKVDTLTGTIIKVKNLGFHSSGLPNSDLEGVAYNASTSKVYMCSEAKGNVIEYDYTAKALTGRVIELGEYYPNMQGNGGIESLTYNSLTNKFWTVNEQPIKKDLSDNGGYRLRINSFDTNFNHLSTYAYLMDDCKKAPNASIHVAGVSELTALDDGRLLVLEREFIVPRAKLGSSCICRIYIINPAAGKKLVNDCALSDDVHFLEKEKLCEWETKLTLFGRQIANYEGMCLGPRLSDGRQMLILVSDSQNQYRHVLKDWFKSIIITPIKP